MFQLRTLAALTVCVAGAAAAATLPAGLLQDDEAQAPMPAEPTDVHKKLLQGVGDWVGTIESTYPGMPPMKSAATETVTALGPYHTVSRFRCEFMGMPYEGLGTMGYDPETETMHGTWTDNANTYQLVMKGEMDLEKGIIDMVYDAPAPDGSGPIRHRNHTELTDDAYSITFYMGAEDEEKQFMRIDMKRKKN